ncbi:MAG: glycosyltransferase family 4 protein [Deltaproteobacteria bacterium]|nr:glycosyltransferase family 4 protein [Deltaproteobacteria bacterium]
MQGLRILHVDPEREWGGGEVQVLGLTTYLHRSGHCSVVAADPQGRLHQHLSNAGLPVRALRVRNHLDLLAGLRLRRLVRAGSYDLVHFHTARAHALSPWLHGMGVKRVVTRRMDYPVKKGLVTHVLYTQSVDAVVAISNGVRAALLAGGVPAARIQVIPSGIDTACFARDPDTRARVRHAYGFGERETVVLAVGALVERKGYGTVLAAAHRLKTCGRRLRYLVCGDGALHAALEAEAQAFGLATDVCFAGFCPDVPGALAAADLFVHVPLHEGLGVAVIEALAAGLPVVASRVGGIPELIEDGKTGLLILSQDPTALAAALDHLVSDPLSASRLGRVGQAVARARFDVTVMARANEALYAELLSSTG